MYCYTKKGKRIKRTDSVIGLLYNISCDRDESRLIVAV